MQTIFQTIRKAVSKSSLKGSDQSHRGVQAQHAQDILNNNPPGATPPSNPRTTDESKDIPKNILAFRTITALLARIQQERKAHGSLSEKPPQPGRLELKISNAFSTIAVMEDEIVAIVTERTPDVLQITACAQAPAKEELVVTPSQPAITSQIWRLLATQNYRRDRTEPKKLPVGKPTITDAMTFANLDLTDDELKRHVDECCYNKDRSSMHRHLSILGKLLTITSLSARDPTHPKASAADSARLRRYVVTTCYPKMAHRLNNKTLSLPLIEALRQIKDFTFSKSNVGEFEEGTESDIQFLTEFVPHVILVTAIPEIRKMTVPNDRRAFRLYTKDTCVEFHALLMEVLQAFKYHLTVLNDNWKSRSQTKAPPLSQEGIKDTVECAFIYGYALHRLTKGAALPMHLKCIACLLKDSYLGAKMTMSTPTPVEQQEPNKEHEVVPQGEADKQLGHEEPDEDLELVQPFVEVDGIEKPLWRSFLDWLRLMVAHFDATDILLTYVTGHSYVYPTISIQVLAAPPVDQILLPLDDLLTDPKLFPTKTTGTSSSTPKADKTNDEILEFLTKGMKCTSVIKSVKKQWNVGPTLRVINEITCELTNLDNSSILGWSDAVEKLCGTLKGYPIPPSLGSEEHSKIAQDMESLLASCAFFESIGPALKKFEGTLHCEACLASLLDETATFSGDILTQMKGFGPIIGISKRCCPVCYHLLSLLSAGGKPFVVRGHHNTVSACTLPGWLPEGIVNSMNKHFGKLLRRELVQILGDTDMFRNRAQSNGSQRLSSDSTELVQQYMEADMFRFTNANITKYPEYQKDLGLGSLGSDARDL